MPFLEGLANRYDRVPGFAADLITASSGMIEGKGWVNGWWLKASWRKKMTLLCAVVRWTENVNI